MVIIVDPHLKRESDYPVYKIASDLDVLIKPKSGESEYEGYVAPPTFLATLIRDRWCWPGSSSWIDFFNPKSWDMWVQFFKTKSIDGSWSWTQSTENVGIWNDMNEVCRNPIWNLTARVTFHVAIGIQRSRDLYAKGQRTLWRMGAPRCA